MYKQLVLGIVTTQTQVIQNSGIGGGQIIANNGGGSSISGNSSGSNKTNNSGNNTVVDNTPQKEENKTPMVKSVSLRQITVDSTFADVEYYISDPENKYQSVYLQIESSNGYSKKIALDKGATGYRITNLAPNTEYKITLAYKEISGNEILDIIDDVINIKTLNINASIKITKITKDRIYFNFMIDGQYIFDSAKLKVYKDGEAYEIQKDGENVGSLEVDIESSKSESGWTSYIDRIDNYDKLVFRVEDVKYEDNLTNYTVEATIKKY